MQVQVKKSDVQITLTLSPEEVKFLSTDFERYKQYMRDDDDDEDDCDCREDDCYECSNGHKVFKELHSVIKEVRQ